MNIKSLLLGSAAALVAVSGARAADAIVAAEPEPVEYVRVCDAFGTGYFYIPGTETCLRISGYVQYQSEIDLDGRRMQPANVIVAAGATGGVFGAAAAPANTPGNFVITGGAATLAVQQAAYAADAAGLRAIANPFPAGAFVSRPAVRGYGKSYEARVQIEAMTETELGTLGSTIRLTATDGPDGDKLDAGPLNVDRAFISLGGLTVGYNASLFDFDPRGEETMMAGGAASGTIRYTYNMGTTAFTLSLEEDGDAMGGDYTPDVVAKVETTVGDFALAAALAYDNSLSVGGLDTGIDGLSAKMVLTYAGFDLGVQWTDDDAALAGALGYLGVNTDGLYGAAYSWVLTGSYTWAATEKVTVTPGVQYGIDFAGINGNQYGASLNVDYQVVDGLTASMRLLYEDGDINDWLGIGGQSSMRLRVRRTF